MEVRERLALLELLDLIRAGNEKNASITELRQELDGLRAMAASRGRSDLEPVEEPTIEESASSVCDSLDAECQWCDDPAVVGCRLCEAPLCRDCHVRTQSGFQCRIYCLDAESDAIQALVAPSNAPPAKCALTSGERHPYPT